MMLSGIRLGFCMTGSFCTFADTFIQLEKLIGMGAEVTPIISYSVRDFDTRFGTATETREKLTALCHHPIIDTIPGAEPLGPKKLLDILVIAPCTGNTMAKIASAITDTPVTLACKAHLRNDRPVVLAVATNDGLSGSARNLGSIRTMRHVYLTPMYQDDPQGKPNSLVAINDLLPDAVVAALEGKQVQPVMGGWM